MSFGPSDAERWHIEQKQQWWHDQAAHDEAARAQAAAQARYLASLTEAEREQLRSDQAALQHAEVILRRSETARAAEDRRRNTPEYLRAKLLEAAEALAQADCPTFEFRAREPDQPMLRGWVINSFTAQGTQDTSNYFRTYTVPVKQILLPEGRLVEAEFRSIMEPRTGWSRLRGKYRAVPAWRETDEYTVDEEYGTHLRLLEAVQGFVREHTSAVTRPSG